MKIFVICNLVQLAFLKALFCIAPLYAQDKSSGDEIVSIHHTCSETIGAGDTLVFQVDVHVNEGWHIYSPDPINRQQGMEPFQIHFSKLPAWIRPVENLSFSPDMTYEGNQVYMGKGHRISQKMVISTDALEGDFLLRGRFIYQGCDATMCFPPMEKSFSQPFAVIKKILEK